MNQPSLFPLPEQTDITSDDYYTPKWLFDMIGIQFDLDVCSPPGGPRHTPAKRYFTQADDGLAQDWEGLVWMNPPYSKPSPWVDRFIEHGNGICLVPFTRAHWFQALWIRSTVMALPQVNMKFEAPSGKMLGIFMPVVLAAIGTEPTDALVRSGMPIKS